MRYAIVGAGGQLGRELGRRLGERAVGFSRAQADLTRPETLEAALRTLKPRAVINCAAYNFVDRAESEPEAAFAVNAWGVRNLARLCRELDCIFVQFSSDFVFGLDENRKEPYVETDTPGPVGVYGLSKLAGEYLARMAGPRHIVIRTCGLYGSPGTGGKGGNFVETMLRLAREGKSIRVVNDQICTPTSCADLAEAVLSLMETERFGLFHLTNFGACTWHEFAGAIFELAGLKANLQPISSQEYGAAARRPFYSVLANSNYEKLKFPPLRNWREALADYLDQRK